MRVVSLLPAGTEIVAALGATDALVGVSHECVLPGHTRSVAVVTSSALGQHLEPVAVNARVAELSATGQALFAMREAEIAELRPDLLITQALCEVCAVHEPDVRALARRIGTRPRVVTLAAGTLELVFEDIITVASALEIRPAGEALVASLRARMKQVHTALGASMAPRPRVAVLEWTDPPYVAGHWVPEMVHRAGGTDVMAVAGQHSRQVVRDALIDAAPAIVLVAPCGYDVRRAAREAHALLKNDEWLARRTVWAVDAARLVSQPGPGLVEGIETFAAIMHPGLFAPPATANAVLLNTAD